MEAKAGGLVGQARTGRARGGEAGRGPSGHICPGALRKRGGLDARAGRSAKAGVARAFGYAMRSAVVAGCDAVGRADMEDAIKGQRRRMLAAAGGA